jgi:hypothetical protein
MDTRRTVLRATALGTVAALAGCSTASDLAGREDSRTHIEAAGEELDLAVRELRDQSDRFEGVEGGDGVDIQTRVVETHLDTASEELDAAEEGASADQRDTIEALRSTVEVLRTATAALDRFAEGLTMLQTGMSYVETERYADAETRFTEARTAFEDVRADLTRVESAVADLDRAEVEGTDASVAEMRSGISRIETSNAALVELSDALASLSRGLVDYQTASSDADAERYRAGARAAGDARDHFASAYSTLTALESSAPARVRSDVVGLSCRAGALRDGAASFRRGCEAAADRRYDVARSEFQAAERALDRCE